MALREGVRKKGNRVGRAKTVVVWPKVHLGNVREKERERERESTKSIFVSDSVLLFLDLLRSSFLSLFEE
jgi:hypothetical protein